MTAPCHESRRHATRMHCTAAYIDNEREAWKERSPRNYFTDRCYCRAEFSLPFSRKRAAATCFEFRLVHAKGRVRAGRHLIGSFQANHEAVIGRRFYRITAATDDGSFLVGCEFLKLCVKRWSRNCVQAIEKKLYSSVPQRNSSPRGGGRFMTSSHSIRCPSWTQCMLDVWTYFQKIARDGSGIHCCISISVAVLFKYCMYSEWIGLYHITEITLQNWQNKSCWRILQHF